jgi:YbbR domain-containing protein
MSFFRKWVLHNWSLKLLALVVSFLLWASYTSEPFVEVGYVVPLEYLNIPTHLELSGDAETHVRVYVRGRAAVLRRLSPADLAIQVDLASTVPGESLVHVTSSQIDVPLGLEVVRIIPSEIRVRLAAHRETPGSPPEATR